MIFVATLHFSPAARSFSQSQECLADQDRVIATVNGEKLTARQLDEATRSQLEPLTRQIERISEAALTRLVDVTLLEQAGRADAVTVEEYLRRQVQVVGVTEQEVEDAYRLGKDRYPDIPAWEAKHQIRRAMEEQRRGQAIHRLIETLRASAVIRNFVEEGRAANRNLRAEQGPFLGRREAPVVVVVFSDFQCPYCRQEQEVQRQLVGKWPKEVRLVYKHLPLDRHANALPAAIASVCADRQGRFWEYHDVLFRKNWDLSKAGLLAAAQTVGLEQQAFQTCFASPEAMNEVERDVQTARKAGVDGTLAYFVNNRRVTAGADLEKVIQGFLKQEFVTGGSR